MGTKRRATGPVALVVSLGILSAWGCGTWTENGTRAGDPPRAVIIVSIDTLRSDRLPTYGYDGVDTPAIDAFRRDAILFERAYSHVPLTLPAHVSLFSGQLPPATGIRDNSGYRLDKGFAPYLPRLLSEAGYATGGGVSAFVLRDATGVAQGFDLYDDEVESTGGIVLEVPERSGEETLAAVTPWLRSVADERFFLFFHLYEPHAPYVPKEPFRSRYSDPYDGEVATADAAFGALLTELRRLRVYDEALILLLSDHGEGLGEHGEQGHGVFVYRESIQIPMLLKLPESERAGESVATPVQLVDVLPTVTNAVGIPSPAGLPGDDLLELPVEGSDERTIYAESMLPRLHYGWSDLTSLVRGRFHYIDAPSPELYDLVNDPRESTNILGDHRRVYAELRAELEELKGPLTAPRKEDAEARRRLAALGYASAAEGLELGEDERPDPKDEYRAFMKQVSAATSAYGRGEYDRAVTLLRESLDTNPAAVDSWLVLGQSLRKLGRLEEAVEAYRQAVSLAAASKGLIPLAEILMQLGRLDEARRHVELARPFVPGAADRLLGEIALADGDVEEATELLRSLEKGGDAAPDLRRQLGLRLSETGDHEAAITVLRELTERHPEPGSRNALAEALLAAGRVEEGEDILRSAIAEAPDDATAHELLGLALVHREALPEARTAIERSLELSGESANAWNLLGVVRLRTGDAPGALRAWQKAVELNPRHLDARYNLAFTAARLGERELAREHLRRYVEQAPAERYSREIARARDLLESL